MNRQIALRLDRYKSNAPKALESLARSYDGASFRPMYADPRRLGAMNKRRPKVARPDYSRYHVIELPSDIDRRSLARLLREVRGTDGVARAYVRGTPSLPALVDAAPNPKSSLQGYLNDAPEGLGIRCAWRMPGGDGAGLRLIDVERGWNTAHPEIARYFGSGVSILGTGQNVAVAKHHGTNVLGIVAGEDNGALGVGIAPGALAVRACSWASGAGFDLDAALTSAWVWLFDHGAPGDVVLIETQIEVDAVGGGVMTVPVGWDEAYYNLIVDLVGSGYVVIEAAGNGDLDLDPYTSASGCLVNYDERNRAGAVVRYETDASLPDSGSILVGGSVSYMGPSSGYVRSGNSNYGDRVDCFAWATGVWTIYDDLWGGTSAAAAIVAGAAMCLQAIRAATSSGRYPPSTVREYLSSADPNVGNTPSAAGAKIGVMPNLPGIIEAKLGLELPDVFLRDHLGDIGDPHAGPAGACPDIIVVEKGSVADPAALDPNAFHGGALGAGTDYEAMVRMKNRGDGDAVAVEASVYWAEPSTLVLPSDWNLIGRAQQPLVPPGATKISPPIDWPAAKLPPPGHYCYVAVLHDACDPAPPAPSLSSFADFLAFVRAHNNVAWRNFNVVPARTSLGLRFSARGGFAAGEWLELLVELDLPPDAAFRLQVGDGVPSRAAKAARALDELLSTLHFPNVGRIPLREIPLPPKTVLPLFAKIRLPKGLRRPHHVRVAQTWRGRALGTITWQLRPE